MFFIWILPVLKSRLVTPNFLFEQAKANVCCVKFNPSSPYNLAFGSADHCVHYYDLRYVSAVSFVGTFLMSLQCDDGDVGGLKWDGEGERERKCCSLAYSDFHNLMGFTAKRCRIIFFTMFVTKVFQLVKLFLANLHYTRSQNLLIYVRYLMTPKNC